MEGLIRKVCLWWAYLASILLLIVVTITVINILAFSLDKFARIFGSNVAGLSGYEDFIRLIMSCIALMYFPWAQVQKCHVAIDFCVEKFSIKTQRTLDIFWSVLTLILVVFLAISMVLGLIESKNDGALSSILGWIEWPFYIPGIISLVMWSMVLLYQIFTPEKMQLQ